MVGVYIVMQCLMAFISLISFGMLIRAILSWFFMGEQTKIGAFLYVLTEPVILPVRRLCQRFGWFQGLPLDMPFIITGLLLAMVMMVIQAWLGV